MAQLSGPTYHEGLQVDFDDDDEPFNARSSDDFTTPVKRLPGATSALSPRSPRTDFKLGSALEDVFSAQVFSPASKGASASEPWSQVPDGADILLLPSSKSPTASSASSVELDVTLKVTLRDPQPGAICRVCLPERFSTKHAARRESTTRWGLLLLGALLAPCAAFSAGPSAANLRKLLANKPRMQSSIDNRWFVDDATWLPAPDAADDADSDGAVTAADLVAAAEAFTTRAKVTAKFMGVKSVPVKRSVRDLAARIAEASADGAHRYNMAELVADSVADAGSQMCCLALAGLAATVLGPAQGEEALRTVGAGLYGVLGNVTKTAVNGACAEGDDECDLTARSTAEDQKADSMAPVRALLEEAKREVGVQSAAQFVLRNALIPALAHRVAEGGVHAVLGFASQCHISAPDLLQGLLPHLT